MTDLHTATAAGELRRARVEELQRRRAAGAATHGSARQGVATGSKIAAAGFGMATMLGLVGVMGLAQGNSGSYDTLQAAPPAQVVVVIHPATTPGATPGATPAVVAATPNQPIVLTAQPTVRQAPASQALAAKTSGSR